ncbi:hypothetical protein LTR36_001298 [Oleoguttula mirabilis]|uniref:glutathione transferase n=1 Tax=Oleoguttula mirabilis TaxID=1507867 RepID=A0AAV9JNT8_9PEZI|nr:hypothetical protein LTR36_001298 [Oleoguttula mirabilis]
MADLKPIKLYSHLGGPNPPKVAIILEELGVPYEQSFMEFGPSFKTEPFISVNPNGRVPAIEDPNTGLKTWESGAIIEYLIDQYDKDAKLHYTSFPEKYEQAAWKHFQMSGQGPYFGQLAWFTLYHSEKGLTSVTDRYKNEVKRVLGVIDAHLTKTKQPYLVGEKICFADLMFVTWNHFAPQMVGDDFDFEKELPAAFAWRQSMEERDSVKKVYADIEKAKAEKGKGGH